MFISPVPKLDPVKARMVLCGLLALVIYGLGVQWRTDREPFPAEIITPHRTDAMLYGDIVSRMEAGESYYVAAVSEQRQNHYPLRPFVTVRLPTLATILAMLGKGGRPVFCLLLACTWLAMTSWLLTGPDPVERIVAVTLSAVALLPFSLPVFVYYHEAWAATLIMLSLSLRGHGQVWPGVLCGLLAVCIRELALPYLLVMAAFAWMEGRKSETMAWSAALACFAAFLAWHAGVVGAITNAGDKSSPGWAVIGGWSFVLSLVYDSTLLNVLPPMWMAVVVPLGLLGWTGAGPIGRRIAVLLALYAAAFTLIGRPNNIYWGCLIGPLLVPGLAFAPRRLMVLGRSAFLPRLLQFT